MGCSGSTEKKEEYPAGASERWIKTADLMKEGKGNVADARASGKFAPEQFNLQVADPEWWTLFNTESAAIMDAVKAADVGECLFGAIPKTHKELLATQQVNNGGLLQIGSGSIKDFELANPCLDAVLFLNVSPWEAPAKLNEIFAEMGYLTDGAAIQNLNGEDALFVKVSADGKGPGFNIHVVGPECHQWAYDSLSLARYLEVNTEASGKYLDYKKSFVKKEEEVAPAAAEGEKKEETAPAAAEEKKAEEAAPAATEEKKEEAAPAAAEEKKEEAAPAAEEKKEEAAPAAAEEPKIVVPKEESDRVIAYNKGKDDVIKPLQAEGATYAAEKLIKTAAAYERFTVVDAEKGAWMMKPKAGKKGAKGGTEWKKRFVWLGKGALLYGEKEMKMEKDVKKEEWVAARAITEATVLESKGPKEQASFGWELECKASLIQFTCESAEKRDIFVDGMTAMIEGFPELKKENEAAAAKKKAEEEDAAAQKKAEEDAAAPAAEEKKDDAAPAAEEKKEEAAPAAEEKKEEAVPAAEEKKDEAAEEKKN